VPIETLETVVNKKRLWIHSKLIEKESLNPPTPAKEYVSGKGFYYLGRSYSLKLVDGEKRWRRGEKLLFDGIAIAFRRF
jgi:hypothetical protein